MAVIVRPKFTKEQIKAMLERKVKALHSAILLNLTRVGEVFVQQARDNDTYKDQTGNLRSSIGYVILRNGKQIKVNFESRGGKQGVRIAKEIARDAQKNFPKGFVLIGVCGMDYAAAVESRGLDVITASSQSAEIALRIAIQRIKLKAA